LSGPDIAELLNGYFEQACEPIIRSGGRILKFLGDGIMALFEPSEADKDGTHAERAVRAALGMQLAAHSFRDWIERRHAGENLPPFAVGVGIHSGEVLMCHVGAQGHGEMTPIGDTVNIASRLEGQAKELGWAVVASDATVKRAGAGVSVGARQSVQLRGRSMPTLAHEVIGLTSSSASAQTPVQLPDEIREALAANARIAAGAAKAALDVTMRIGNEVTEAFRRKPVNIQGYKLISKIAQGGSSVVHLAQRESDQHKVVLKILTVSAGQDTMSLQRFLQEFDIISAIDHPNVVKIYDRGFSEDRAYIVMEYFSGGTLADAIAAGLSERQAMSLLAQATSALREVHSRGVIHRDIKPANLMAREDGSIALADFGIAKRLGEDFSRTRHGELYGTPYYVSPEQIHGRPATNQSDIYALGLIFYEMLTRERPFQAEGVSELMVQHATAPRPRLPAAQKEYQGLLDRMLAIDPGERFGSADELLDAIDAVWTKHAMRAFQTASR
jgi:class 3 adenylate cyclase/tRNA A-37 threonylcarbamoyl transferase component Bud32